MAIQIREATVDDAAAIALAHMRAWQVAYDGIVPSSFLDAIDLDERTSVWRSNLEADRLPNGWKAPTDFVAVSDGTVVGFVNAGLWRGDPEDARSAEVWAIYVHPDHWGSGAGYLLLKRAVEHLIEARAHVAYLWVLEDNGRARQFYERQGWTADEITQTIDIADTPILERRYSITLVKNER